MEICQLGRLGLLVALVVVGSSWPLAGQTPVPVGVPVELGAELTSPAIVAEKTRLGVGAVVVFSDDTTTYSSFFGPDGEPVRADEVLLPIAMGSLADIELAADGSYILVWIARSGATDSVNLLQVDGAGQVYGPFLVHEGAADPDEEYDGVRATKLSDSEIFVTWSRFDRDPEFEHSIHGAKVGSVPMSQEPLRISPLMDLFEVEAAVNPYRAHDVAFLSDGRIVIAWHEDDTDEVKFQYFTQALVPLGEPELLRFEDFGVENMTDFPAFITVEASSSGSFLLGAGRDCQFQPTPVATALRIAQDGSVQHSFSMPMPFTAGSLERISISEAVSGEVLMISGELHCGHPAPSGEGTWGNIFQRFAEDGEPLGSPGRFLGNDHRSQRSGGLISEHEALLIYRQDQRLFVQKLDREPALRLGAPLLLGEGAPIVMPVELDIFDASLAGVAFSIDFDESCLAIDPTDSDVDGLPDAIAAAAIPQGLLDISFDPSDSDGEIDVLVYQQSLPFAPLGSGELLAIEFQSSCPPTATDPSRSFVVFSAAPPPSFSDLGGLSVAGGVEHGWVEIWSGQRGDANADGVIEISDLISLVLEIFDGDGDFWTNVGDGTQASDPFGADANEDTLVDSADVTCIGRLIFGESCQAPGGSALLGSPSVPVVSIPASGELGAGGLLTFPVLLDSGGHSLASMAFSLDFDAGTGFDLETGISASVPASWLSLSYDPLDEDGELDVLIASPASASPSMLPEGALLEISVTNPPGGHPVAVPARFSQLPKLSLGDVFGLSVRGQSVRMPLFGDGFESGGLGAWSVAVP